MIVYKKQFKVQKLTTVLHLDSIAHFATARGKQRRSRNVIPQEDNNKKCAAPLGTT